MCISLFVTLAFEDEIESRIGIDVYNFHSTFDSGGGIPGRLDALRV